MRRAGAARADSGLGAALAPGTLATLGNSEGGGRPLSNYICRKKHGHPVFGRMLVPEVVHPCSLSAFISAPVEAVRSTADP